MVFLSHCQQRNNVTKERVSNDNEMITSILYDYMIIINYRCVLYTELPLCFIYQITVMFYIPNYHYVLYTNIALSYLPDTRLYHSSLS